jgi:hypothetical protein
VEAYQPRVGGGGVVGIAMLGRGSTSNPRLASIPALAALSRVPELASASRSGAFSAEHLAITGRVPVYRASPIKVDRDHGRHPRRPAQPMVAGIECIAHDDPQRLRYADAALTR